MKLTGKAKEDFEQWFKSKKATPRFRWWMMFTLDTTTVNSTIIDWFDTVGIYIVPFKDLDHPNNDWTWLVNDNYTHDYFKTRQEAISDAIDKANEIYNLKQE